MKQAPLLQHHRIQVMSAASPNRLTLHLRDLTPPPQKVPLGRYTFHFLYFMLTHFQYNSGANDWWNRGRRHASHYHSSRCPVVPLQELEEKKANLYCTPCGGAKSLTRIAKPHNNEFDGL